MVQGRLNMSVIFKGVKEIGAREQTEAPRREEWLKLALTKLFEYSAQPDLIKERISTITQADSGIRCASPTNEAINRGVPCWDEAYPPVLIVAGDASQVNPEETDVVEFGMINIGLFRWLPDGHTTEEMTFTRFLHHEDLIAEDGWPIEEAQFKLMRDVYERTTLIAQALKELPPVTALIDGSLELFRQPGSTLKSKKLTKTYLEALRRLANENILLAGYIDRPKANLVVRMLELAMLEDGQLKRARLINPLGMLRDATIFRYILEPGERSAIFSIHSTSSKIYSGKLTPHFFYLNVAPFNIKEFPWIARVEIPEWVAQNPPLVNSLQHTLLTQAKMLGNKPYPYALFRAHEIALITHQNANSVSEMIEHEFRSLGLEVMEKSMKQQLKNMIG